MLAAITSPSWSPAIFVSIQFAPAASSPNPVLLWTGTQNITTSLVTGTSATFAGAGSFLSISQIEDGATVEARGIVLTFSGLNPTLVPDALADITLGLPVTIWLAAMSGGVPIASPVVLWSGAVDRPSFTVSGDTAELSINCENLLVSLNVPTDRRLTQQDQAMDWPGDIGLSFTPGLIEIVIYWGQAATTANV